MIRRFLPRSALLVVAVVFVGCTTAPTTPATQPTTQNASATQPASPSQPSVASSRPASSPASASASSGTTAGSSGAAMTCTLLKEPEVVALIGALGPVPSPRRVAIPHPGGTLVDSCEYLGVKVGVSVTYSVWTFAGADLGALVTKDTAAYAAAGLKPFPTAVGNMSTGAYQTVGTFAGTQIAVADGTWYIVVTVGGPDLVDAQQLTRDMAGLVANQGG